MNLLDQLNSNINMDGMTTSKADVMPPRRPQKDLSEMKFTHTLIKHLDAVYSKMLAGEVAEMTEDPRMDPNVIEIEGATDSVFLQGTKNWYQQGNSNVTESM